MHSVLVGIYSFPLQHIRFASELTVKVTAECFSYLPIFKIFFYGWICTVFKCMNYHKCLVVELTKYNLISGRVAVVFGCAFDDFCVTIFNNRCDFTIKLDSFKGYLPVFVGYIKDFTTEAKTSEEACSKAVIDSVDIIVLAKYRPI